MAFYKRNCQVEMKVNDEDIKEYVHGESDNRAQVDYHAESLSVVKKITIMKITPQKMK
jgi:hypothetical protein